MHLVVVFGPQAVGKMTVGREIARRTPYRLFHNHATIEPLVEVFDWGTPALERLKLEFRRRVIEEAVAADLPGLVFTFVWGLDLAEDTAYVEELLAPVLDAGGRVDFVELVAGLDTRLGREGGADRIAAKPSKADVAWHRRHLVDSAREHRLETGPDQPFPLAHPHLVVDNDGADPAATAVRIIEALGLPTR
jgi:hypothetical protein